MVAWLAGSCDADSYGRLVAYHFPKGKNVYGTMQIENRIDSDPNISREMTLWGQGGSNVIRGNMLVVPIDDALIYIEPIYISSNASDGNKSNTIPELKRVIVAYEESIVMETTLERALASIFNGTASKAPTDALQTEKPSDDGETMSPVQEVTLNDAIDSVIEGYYTAKSGSTVGDWSQFGEGMKALESAIGELEKFRRE